MNSRVLKPLIRTVAVLSALYLIGYIGIWQWMFCRVYVKPGESLLLRYKGPFPFGNVEQAPEGTLVSLDANGAPIKVGILEAMPGPGRHFYSPLEYERNIVEDTVIETGKLGIVVSKVGLPLPTGTFLADEVGYRGMWRRVLTPGRYRMNNYAYDVKIVDVDACLSAATPNKNRKGDVALIAPGYVGVVTNKTDNPKTKQKQGIQDEVLQPGIYFLNPEEKQIDIISVGYNETTLQVEMVKNADGSARMQDGTTLGSRGGGGRTGASTAPAPSKITSVEGKDPIYKPGTGIEFPSNDGFPIHLDYTTIWGILPDQAPDIVRQFGTLKDVEQKVVLPQVGSICRLYGSKRGAVDLLVGDTREAFQTDTAEELEKVFEQKNLTLLFGLTRHIYVPNQVREPIQKAKIADELKLTRDQEQLTAKAQADLTEAEAKVVLEERRTKADTLKLVALVAAEGEKKAKEIEATTEKLRAEIDAKTAIVEAQTTRAMGEAAAKTTELKNAAEADRFRQYVQALGGPDAYNRYVFAENLPTDLRIALFHAGPGTFWTDLKGFEQTMLGKLASETIPAKSPSPGMIPASSTR